MIHLHSHPPTTLDEIQHSTDLTDLTDSVEAVGWGPTFDSFIGGAPLQALSAHSLCVFVCGFALLCCCCVGARWGWACTHVFGLVCVRVWCCVGVGLSFCSITLGSTCVGISRLDWAPRRARASLFSSLSAYVTHPHSHTPTTLDEIQHSTD